MQIDELAPLNDEVLLTDAEINRARAHALLDGETAKAERYKTILKQRHDSEEDARLVEEARAERQRDEDRAKYDALLEKWASQLPHLAAIYCERRDALTNQSDLTEIRAVHRLNVGLCSLRNELNKFDPHRFPKSMYRVADLDAAGPMADVYLASLRRPNQPQVITQPWKADLQEAWEIGQRLGLLPESPIGNGG
jgi:hypothetical protein